MLTHEMTIADFSSNLNIALEVLISLTVEPTLLGPRKSVLISGTKYVIRCCTGMKQSVEGVHILGVPL